MSAIFVLLSIDVLTFPGYVHGQVPFAGHGINIPGFTNLDSFQCAACCVHGTVEVDLPFAVEIVLGFDHVVGEVGQARQFILGRKLPVFLVGQELLVVRIKEVYGESSKVVEIVLAGLGDAEIRLLVGDPAYHRADHNNRDQYQWQNDNGHFPADSQIVDEFKQMEAHSRINVSSEMSRLCCLWDKKAIGGVGGRGRGKG